MLIGELSERTGLSRDTIRFYEKKGLISIPEKLRKHNNYKDYPEQVFNRLQLIITIKNLGFTLNETGSFLRSWNDDETSCEKDGSEFKLRGKARVTNKLNAQF